MKILHINGNYIWSELHRELVSNLVDSGVECCVAIPTYDMNAGTVNVSEDKNAHILVCFKRNDRFFFRRKQRKIMTAIINSLDAGRYDCIHAHTMFTDGNVARALSEKYGIPYVVTVRNTDVNFFLKKIIFLRGLENKILNKSSGVFFISESYFGKTLEYVKNKEDIALKKYVIPNGAGEYWLSNIYHPRKAIEIMSKKFIKILYVGSINKNKNIEMVLKAAELLKSRGFEIKYSIIGNVQDEKLAKKIGKHRDVVIYPEMSAEELLHHYRKNDIFIMPSHTETFGLVYVEAMSQGLPVIYTRGEGFDGQFPDGEVGYSVADTDPSDIADKVCMILDDYENISARCIRQVSRFNWKNIALKYKEIYSNIVEHRS